MRGLQAIGAMAMLIAGAGGGAPAFAQSMTAIPVAAAAAGPGRVPRPQAVVPGGSVQRSAAIGHNLRLRVALTATASGPRDHVRQRIASSMIDVYPFGTSGFHLSAGTRMYDPRIGEQATSRGLMAVRRPGGAPGGRLGMRRTPAFTLGYAGEILDHATMGIEVGAMMGHAYTAGPTDVARRLRGELPSGNPVNPMVNLVFGRRF